mgnify:CR=1 FL=1
MKRISIVLVLLLNSCNQGLTTQATNIKDTKVEGNNVLVNPVLPFPSPTPTPIITPVSSVLIINPSPSPSISTSTSNSVNSQSTFIPPIPTPSPTANNSTNSGFTLPPPPDPSNASNLGAGPSISFSDQPPPAQPSYSEIRPLPPETIRDGYITLVFRDESKIRIEKENILIVNSTAKFKTLLTTQDINLKSQIDNINQIIKELNIKFSEIFVASMTEKEALDMEKSSGTSYPGYDVINMLSSYDIKLTNQDIASLIKKLREFTIVRECNFNYPATNG